MRAGGNIQWSGATEEAKLLADAMAAAAREDRRAETLTHPFHTYPARMHPATARRLVEALAGGRGASLLDPFCGSGTTLVEARAAGLRAVGSDLNPIAVGVARTKTWTAPRPRRVELQRIGQEIAAEALAEGKAARRAGHRQAALRRVGRDPMARDRALGEWFAPHVRRELEQLAALVEEVGEHDAELAGHLRVVLSSLLYKVSRRASDTDGRRVERQVGRGQAARLFGARVELLCSGLDQLASASGPMVRVETADARHLHRVAASGSIGAVVTSPPYAGTYDYADQHALRLLFFGLDPAAVAKGEIGARARFKAGQERALADHAADTGAYLAEVARVLAPGGRAAIVVGDSLAGRTAVHADRVLRAACPPELVVIAVASQERPILGAERRVFGGEQPPKREHLLLLERR